MNPEENKDNVNTTSTPNEATPNTSTGIQPKTATPSEPVTGAVNPDSKKPQE